VCGGVESFVCAGKEGECVRAEGEIVCVN
jgi:hypothetical protein